MQLGTRLLTGRTAAGLTDEQEWAVQVPPPFLLLTLPIGMLVPFVCDLWPLAHGSGCVNTVHPPEHRFALSKHCVLLPACQLV